MANGLKDVHEAAPSGASAVEPLAHARFASSLMVVVGMLVTFVPLLILGADTFFDVPSWLTSVAMVLVPAGAAAFTYFSYVCAKAQGVRTGRVMWRTLTAPISFLWNLP